MFKLFSPNFSAKKIDFEKLFLQISKTQNQREELVLKKKMMKQLQRHFNLTSNSLKPRKADQPLLDILAEQLIKNVKTGRVKPDKLSSSIYEIVDRYLLDDLLCGVEKYAHQAESFYCSWFESVVNSKKTKSRFPSKNDRMDVFTDTFIRCLDKVRNNTFLRKSSLYTFFYKMFNDKCIDKQRALLSKKNSMYGTDFDEHLLMLNPKNRRKLLEMPKEYLGDLFEMLKKYNPKCVELLIRYHDGYPYSELQTIYAKTKSQLRDDIYHCKKRLFKYYQEMEHNNY